MKVVNFFAILPLLCLLSCGNNNGGSSSGQREENQRPLIEATPGTYYAVLRPVNFQANGFIPYGAATFKLQNDDLQVNVVLDDDQAVPHRQALHLGTRCPGLADDTNGDGFVDYDEAQRVVGQAMMPLDADLKSQSAGKDVYPQGPAMTYNKTASLTHVNEDLWAADEDPSDNITKLPSGNGIGFEGRVVLVHGTTLQPNFPASLSSFEGEPAHLSLPVVCGILKKIE